MSRDKKDRFQYQPWHIKLWRYRHYIPVPVMAVKFWLKERKRPLSYEHDWRAGFREMWGLAIGLQQVKMNWVYDLEDLDRAILGEEYDEYMGTQGSEQSQT